VPVVLLLLGTRLRFHKQDALTGEGLVRRRACCAAFVGHRAAALELGALMGGGLGVAQPLLLMFLGQHRLLGACTCVG